MERRSTPKRIPLRFAFHSQPVHRYHLFLAPLQSAGHVESPLLYRQQELRQRGHHSQLRHDGERVPWRGRTRDRELRELLGAHGQAVALCFRSRVMCWGSACVRCSPTRDCNVSFVFKLFDCLIVCLFACLLAALLPYLASFACNIQFRFV